MEIPKKERIKHDWYLIVYQEPSKRYSLSATYNKGSYENHLKMIKSFGVIIAIKEGVTKEEKTIAAKLVEAKNNSKIMDIEKELEKLNFTLPRAQARQ